MYKCVYILHRIYPLLAAKLGFLLVRSPFLLAGILAEAFQNDHFTACSTALRSATEKNEMGGYVNGSASFQNDTV